MRKIIALATLAAVVMGGCSAPRSGALPDQPSTRVVTGKLAIPKHPQSTPRRLKDGESYSRIGSTTSSTAFQAGYYAMFSMGGDGMPLVERSTTPQDCSAMEYDACNVALCDENDPDCVDRLDVARVPPVPDAHCGKSTLGLANNIPANTSDRAHQVVDIYMTMESGNHGTLLGVTGTVYLMGDNASAYLEDSGVNPSFFQQSLGLIPVLGPILDRWTATHGPGVLTPMSRDQAQTYIHELNRQRGKSAGSCFTKPLYA